jgi:hypothetical protein
MRDGSVSLRNPSTLPPSTPQTSQRFCPWRVSCGPRREYEPLAGGCLRRA